MMAQDIGSVMSIRNATERTTAATSAWRWWSQAQRIISGARMTKSWTKRCGAANIESNNPSDNRCWSEINFNRRREINSATVAAHANPADTATTTSEVAPNDTSILGRDSPVRATILEDIWRSHSRVSDHPSIAMLEIAQMAAPARNPKS